MRCKLLIGFAFLFSSLSLSAQEPAASFRQAVPGWEFSFPRDHGSHDEFQTEWWYFTGHLIGPAGRRFGYELTFFRVGVNPAGGGMASAWELENLALAHFAVTDIARRDFRFYEKVNRVSPFTAGAARGNLDVFNESWSARAAPDGSWRIRAAGGKDGLDLVLRSRKPPAIHGTDGVSVKGKEAGAASHYYSMTRLEAEGKLVVDGESFDVAGESWMDHEFSTSILDETQSGWDWFSLQLENGTELMLYQIRTNAGGVDPASSGSFIDTAGKVLHLRDSDFTIRPMGSWKSPESGGVYPMGWRIEVPGLGLSLTVREEMKAQELVTSASTGITYWEGAVQVRGRSRGAEVRGAGYVELTGYASPFRMPGKAGARD
ncbi:MAG: lipocalin-like domain-containing protein [Thermoanaerobaculia bacterium]